MTGVDLACGCRHDIDAWHRSGDRLIVCTCGRQWTVTVRPMLHVDAVERATARRREGGAT